MKKLGLVSILLLIGLAACDSDDSSVSGTGNDLTGPAALNSMGTFQIQDESPIFEWSTNSSDKLDFAIQSCNDVECKPMYKINCIGNSYCIVHDEWLHSDLSFSHRFFHPEDNPRRFRLEICDINHLGFNSNIQIEIQALNAFGSGPWVKANMTSLSMDGYCH